MVFVSMVSAESVPDTFTASVICIPADVVDDMMSVSKDWICTLTESSPTISCTLKVPPIVTAPETFNPSSI